MYAFPVPTSSKVYDRPKPFSNHTYQVCFPITTNLAKPQAIWAILTQVYRRRSCNELCIAIRRPYDVCQDMLVCRLSPALYATIIWVWLWATCGVWSKWLYCRYCASCWSCCSSAVFGLFAVEVPRCAYTCKVFVGVESIGHDTSGQASNAPCALVANTHH